jgi:hypothetical protein
MQAVGILPGTRPPSLRVMSLEAEGTTADIEGNKTVNQAIDEAVKARNAVYEDKMLMC